MRGQWYWLFALIRIVNTNKHAVNFISTFNLFNVTFTKLLIATYNNILYVADNMQEILDQSQTSLPIGRKHMIGTFGQPRTQPVLKCTWHFGNKFLVFIRMFTWLFILWYVDYSLLVVIKSWEWFNFIETLYFTRLSVHC